MKPIHCLLFFAFTAIFFSCKPTQQIPNYIQDTSSGELNSVRIPEIIIQKNDLLSILIYSASIKPEISDRIYNLPTSTGAENGSSNTMASGYLVDNSGNIEMPRIGQVHAEGLTKNQLADLIKEKINELGELIRPSVIIRFLNLKVTVLGEVNQQGTITIPGERVNVFEALGLAGGLTQYAQKENVKIVREVNGKREIGYVDISSKNIFDSPYFQLQQNDMVMVDPHPRRAKVEDQNMTMQRISLGLSIVTALGLLYNIFSRN